ncbi:MAG: hypothetical protein U0163_00175 [Gemmatimonadaceae bacterium]
MGVLWANLAVFAEPQRPVTDPAMYQHGKVETVVGAMLVGLGAVTLAATTADRSTKRLAPVGYAELVAGGWYLFRGANDRKAGRAETTFGVHVGKRSALLIQRRW